MSELRDTGNPIPPPEKSKALFDAMTAELHKPRPTVGSGGLAIHRDPESDVSVAARTFEKLANPVGSAVLAGQILVPRLCQLREEETKRQKPLKQVELLEAIDELYENVPALMDKRPFIVSRVGLLNLYDGQRPIALLPDRMTEDALKEERAKIIDTLEAVGRQRHGHYRWDYFRVAIPFAAVDPELESERLSALIAGIEVAIPRNFMLSDAVFNETQ